ncbi:hypothetical protein C8R45DRAFT_1105350 [Mycena sanguinolenta]|nr:hypothetical protein C8R45DRAFT_1105350 [Mycena sanguinolenta]
MSSPERQLSPLHQRQHADRLRFQCAECKQLFSTPERLAAHQATFHPRFPCTICKVSFAARSSLDDHYRGKTSFIHPNCSRCGKGFFDQRALDEASPSVRDLCNLLTYLQHFQATHPKEKCPCGHDIFVEDLAIHYKDSAQHPTCIQCGSGLKDDAAWNEHSAAEHPESRCASCARHFNSAEDLQTHFNVSASHPKCSQCGVGFETDAILNEHVLSPPSEFASGPHFKAPLPVERAPTISLPPPGQKANKAWDLTPQNQAVPLYPFAKGPWDASGLTANKYPTTRLFTQARKALTEQKLASASHSQAMPSSFGPTPTIQTPQSDSYNSRSAKGSVTSAVSPRDQAAKIVSPQSSTSDPSTVIHGKGNAVMSAAFVPCTVCKGHAIEPTAAFCGHIFCDLCVLS